MPFEVVVLGSGTSVPRPGHAPAAHLLLAGGTALLLDCGAVAALHMAEIGVSPDDLDGVAITHFHADHTAGLVPLLQGMWAHPGFRRERSLTVAGPAGLGERIEAASGAWGFLKEAMEGIVDLRSWDDGEVTVGPFEVTPMPVEHAEGSVALRIEGPGGLVCYSGDCNRAEDLSKAALGADLFIAGCGRRRGVDGPHLSADEVAWAASQAGVRRVVLVHLYPDIDVDEALEVVGGVADVTAARDLDRFTVG